MESDDIDDTFKIELPITRIYLIWGHTLMTSLVLGWGGLNKT